MSENVVSEIHGAVARLVLNRPLKRNAQSRALLEDLDRAFEAVREDQAVRVVVLAAAGDHFSAGHDLADAAADRPNMDVEARFGFEERVYFDYCMRIRDFPKPTLAAVQGGCIAAGFMLANMCDLIVAADDAFFADPVVHLFGAAAVEVLIHPYVLGTRAARDMLFTGRRMSAEECHRLGMVSRLVPRPFLERETMSLAAEIAKAPPFALKLIKRSLNRAEDLGGFRDAMNAHFDTHQLAHTSSESTRMIGEMLAREREKAALSQ